MITFKKCQKGKIDDNLQFCRLHRQFKDNDVYLGFTEIPELTVLPKPTNKQFLTIVFAKKGKPT